MELSTLFILGGSAALFLAASVALAVLYNRQHARNQVVERDRNGFLEILESTNDALFVINFVNGRIHQANESAARLLGYTRAQLAGLTIFDLHPSEFLEQSASRVADAWEQQGSIFDDIPMLNAHGERIPVECSTRVTSYSGSPAIVLFARDTRERLALRQKIEAQQAVVREQNQELVASIRYAERIQRAVLPQAEKLTDLFPESFVLFRPRDIVSGDLYWVAEKEGKVVLAAADCTGHGVPGALLSLIGISVLEEMVHEKGLYEPAKILDGARQRIITTLSRNEEGADRREGMNAGVITVDQRTGTLNYAGAFSPLYIIRRRQLIEHKGDRMPVGRHEAAITPFDQVEMTLEPGDRIFLFSDGLPDQFGGPQGKKLRTAGLKQWLLETCDLSMDEQHQGLSDRFRMWKGEEDQVDDVLLIGVEWMPSAA